MTTSTKDAPLQAPLIGAMGLCVSCAVLPMVFGFAGADPDLTRTQVIFWVCVAASAALSYLWGEMRWRRWASERS